MKDHAFQGHTTGPCTYVEEGKTCLQPVGYEVHYKSPRGPLAGVSEGLAKAFTFPGTFSVRGQEQHWPGSAEAVWQAHSKMVADLLARKQAYGDAWIEQGYMGNIARILSKTSRIKNVAWRDDDGGEVRTVGSEETLLDTLKDLSALCAFAIANLEEGNRWGK